MFHLKGLGRVGLNSRFMDNLLNNVLKREIGRQRAALPFCIRLASSETSTNSTASSSDKELPAKQENKTPNLEENPYYSKYAEKLAQAKKGGVGKGVQDKVSSEQEKVRLGFEELEAKLSTSKNDHDPGPRKGENASSSRPKTLNDIVHISKLEGHTAEEITEIWSQFHRTKEECIYAVLPSSSYDKIYELATQYPIFLFPLPRIDKAAADGQPKEGYEFFLGQFVSHAFYFTPLALYQRYKDVAPPCVVLHHYPELSPKKGIVLMSGEFDKNAVNLLEAQCLANQIKLFYGGDDIAKKMLLHTFNRDAEKFQHVDLVKEFEQSLVPGKLKA